MLFLQPVVVGDAGAMDRSPAAEVRIVERRTLEQPRWNGTVLAQGSLDQRSPFGSNAPNMNDSTPAARVPPPSDSTQPGSTSGQLADPMSTTRIPPPANVPDAGPPPPAGTTTTTPGTAPSTVTPGAPRTGTTSTAPTTPGAGVPSTVSTPGGNPPGATVPGTSAPAPVPTPAPSSSSTLPGVSSGASNTR